MECKDCKLNLACPREYWSDRVNLTHKLGCYNYQEGGIINVIETGIFIRAQVDGKWGSYDIGDKKVPDVDILKWLRSRGEKNSFAEKVVMTLLNRNQGVVD